MQDIKTNGLKKILFGVCIAVLSLSVVLLALAYIFTGDTLRKGIRIEQTDVSWLSEEEAKNLVTKNLERIYHSDRIALKYGERQWDISLDSIEYRFLVAESVKKAFMIGRTGNFFKKVYQSVLLSLNGQQLDVGVSYQRDKLKSILKKIKNECDSTAKNAEIAYKPGSIKFTHENMGKRLDIDRNIELVENHLIKREFDVIEIQVDELKPHIVYDEIKDINSVAAHFSTRFGTADTNRSDNIRLACSRIDNKILLPGEEFSMNEALGPRTLENGYKEAPVILKSELVTGTGGGICQVSSTLYNSVLLAGLEVTERAHHSMPLSYISPGRDATITEDSIDFRFINSSEYPICIKTDIRGSVLNVSVLGKKREDGKIIKIKTETIAEYPPEQEEVILDDTLQFGEKVIERKAIKGLRVVLYRETYKDGALLSSEKLTEDYYRPVQGKVRVSSELYEANPSQKPEYIY